MLQANQKNTRTLYNRHRDMISQSPKNENRILIDDK
jgi:hypothetical protein